jgi:hypothetical protein
VASSHSNIDLSDQNTPHIISGTGNINSNPLFLNIDLGAGSDGKWMTLDDGLQLTTDSPGINIGDNTNVAEVDFLFNERIKNTTVDMGAYEFQGEPTVIAALPKSNINNRINAFPNPSKGLISIETSHLLENTPYSIIDVVGRPIKTGTLTNRQTIINIAQQEKGIYFLITQNKVVRLVIE